MYCYVLSTLWCSKNKHLDLRVRSLIGGQKGEEEEVRQLIEFGARRQLARAVIYKISYETSQHRSSLDAVWVWHIYMDIHGNNC